MLLTVPQVMVQKIHSKVEGVREDVRVGRNLLLADAASDLIRMRAERCDGPAFFCSFAELVVQY